MELERLQKQILLLEKANRTLNKAFSQEKHSQLEIDWIIQRFEYTIELTWKTLKKVLEFEGQNNNLFPKEVFKECYKVQLINNLDIWFNLLEQRNILSHFYIEHLSEQSFNYIKNNHSIITELIENLRNKYLKQA